MGASSSTESWCGGPFPRSHPRFAHLGVANQRRERRMTGNVIALPSVEEAPLDNVSAQESPGGPEAQLEQTRGAHGRTALGQEFIAEGNNFFQPPVDRVGAVMFEVSAQLLDRPIHHDVRMGIYAAP